MSNVKIIFHIDLNAFYASCHAIEDPYLKNKAFVVGGSGVTLKGVVTSASYPARKKGIKSGMTIGEAIKIYPKLYILPVNFSLYKKQSNIFFNYLKKYSKLILKGSIDEAYLDMTKYIKNEDGIKVARKLQKELLNEYMLPVSIGIAPTLYLAKMASDLKKPLGITVIRRKDIINKLFHLPVSEIFGIGRKTYPLLIDLGILTIGDFVKDINKNKILKIMSENSYDDFISSLLGMSSDVVDPNKYKIPKSISNERTLSSNINNRELLFDMLVDLFKEIVDKLINYQLVAKTLTIKYKDNNFKLKTRSISFEETDDYFKLRTTMEVLFENTYNDDELRLIGVGLSNLLEKDEIKEEFNLFTYQKSLTKTNI